MRQKHPRRTWTDEEKEYIEKYYSKKDPVDIAKHLNRTTTSIFQYAKRVGLKSGRFYSDYEKKFVFKWAGKKTIAQIAKSIGRTKTSVSTFMNANGISTVCGDESSMILAEISQLVGLDDATISGTWAKYGLKIKKVGIYSMVNIDELLDFMKSHPERWDATKCEKWYFEQYDWWQEKRKTDFEKMKAARWAHEKTLKGA